MFRIQRLVFLSVFILSGCPTRSKDVGNDGGGGDAGSPPSIQITSPAPNTYTNAGLSVTVQAGNGEVLPMVSVYVDADTTPLTTMTTPFTVTWDTTTVHEGAHTLTAKAVVATQAIASAPVTVHVDRTPPTFTTLPAANSMNVALSDPIRLIFSEPLAPASVTNASVTLTSGGVALNTTATLGTDMETITVVLGSHSSLSLPATVTEKLAGTVTDLAGNSVATPSWSWTAPLWVKLPALPGQAPALALDPQGNAIASFTVDTSSTTQLSVVRYAPGATWDLSFGSLPTIAGMSVSAAKLVVNSGGAPTVAWSQDHIYAASWVGSAWVAFPGYADATAASSVNPPFVSSVVLDSIGAPLVGWGDGIALDTYGYVGEWMSSTWELLPSGMRAGTGGPTLVVSSAGSLVGIFPGGFGVPGPFIQTYQAGSWLKITSPAAGFSNGVGMLDALTLDSQDEPVTLVETLEPDVEVLHVEVLRANAWTDLVPSLSTQQAQNGVGEAHVELGPDGAPFILWTEPDGTSSLSIHLARYTGTAWDTTYGILNGISTMGTDVVFPAVAIDKTGTPTVIWSETDASTAVPYVFLWKSNY